MVKMGRTRRAKSERRITDFFAKEDEVKKEVKVENEEETPSKKGKRKSVLTDYFPVRRSARRGEGKEEGSEGLKRVLKGDESGVRVVLVEGKGRGVVAERAFRRGEAVLEYAGELLESSVEARQREALYSSDPSKGCYMYYFRCGERRYCVDATEESGRLGRLVNHSRHGNLVTRALTSSTQPPRLLLLAARDISPGRELTYDYGDRSKDSLRHHPWLKL